MNWHCEDMNLGPTVIAHLLSTSVTISDGHASISLYVSSTGMKIHELNSPLHRCLRLNRINAKCMNACAILQDKLFGS